MRKVYGGREVYGSRGHIMLQLENLLESPQERQMTGPRKFDCTHCLWSVAESHQTLRESHGHIMLQLENLRKVPRDICPCVRFTADGTQPRARKRCRQMCPNSSLAAARGRGRGKGAVKCAHPTTNNAAFSGKIHGHIMLQLENLPESPQEQITGHRKFHCTHCLSIVAESLPTLQESHGHIMLQLENLPESPKEYYWPSQADLEVPRRKRPGGRHPPSRDWQHRL